jgi:hypothetical protein
VGLHYIHLSASIAYDYTEHKHEMFRVNETTDALSIGPSAGYSVLRICVYFTVFSAYVSSDIHMDIHVVKYITLVL